MIFCEGSAAAAQWLLTQRPNRRVLLRRGPPRGGSPVVWASLLLKHFCFYNSSKHRKKTKKTKKKHPQILKSLMTPSHRPSGDSHFNSWGSSLRFHRLAGKAERYLSSLLCWPLPLILILLSVSLQSFEGAESQPTFSQSLKLIVRANNHGMEAKEATKVPLSPCGTFASSYLWQRLTLINERDCEKVNITSVALVNIASIQFPAATARATEHYQTGPSSPYIYSPRVRLWSLHSLEFSPGRRLGRAYGILQQMDFMGVLYGWQH